MYDKTICMIRFLDYTYDLRILFPKRLALQKRRKNPTLSVILYKTLSRDALKIWL